MADMSGFSSGNFIKADEVKEVTRKGQPFVVVILNEAVLVKTNFNGQEGERVECEVGTQDNKERAISLNRTSVGNLVKEWGADSNTWIGHKISLMTQMTKIGKDAIYATPVEGDAVMIKQGVLK